MSAPRTIFLEILDEQFKDPAIEKECVDAVNSIAMLPCTFDYLKKTMQEDDLERLTNIFRNLLIKINKTRRLDHELTIREQIFLIIFERIIANRGYEFLLDETGDTHPDIIKKLKYRNKGCLLISMDSPPDKN